MPSDVNLGVRSPKGLLPLRFPIAHDHVVILKFNSPFRIITGHKLGASRLRMAPEGLFKACPPAACTIARPDLPARLGTPVDLRSTPIRGRGFAAYLSGCARQPFIVRCAHYARGGFAHYVRLRHYRSSLLAAASNALTFVRGANPRLLCAA